MDHPNFAALRKIMIRIILSDITSKEFIRLL